MNFKNISLTFPKIHNEELEKLIAKYSCKKKYKKGTVLKLPGDTLNCVFYIKEGKTRHYMENNEGIEKLLYILNTGWLFGEMSHTLGYKTGLYTMAETDTVLYIISSENVDKLLNESILFQNAVRKCLAQKLVILRHEIENLTFNSIKDRIKRLFVMLVNTEKIYDDNWYGVNIEYTQYQIGVLIGGARVSVSRTINELCKEGFIRIVNRKPQINCKAYLKYTEEMNIIN